MSVLRHAAIAMIGLGGGACALEMSFLYTSPAPFHQIFRDATDEQNREISRRLFGALVYLPICAIGFLGLIFASRPGTARPDAAHQDAVLPGAAHRGATLRVVAWATVVAFLAALHACSVRSTLPYGFGDGYEHASAEQLGHLRLAGTAGMLWLGATAVGVCVLVARAIARRGTGGPGM